MTSLLVVGGTLAAFHHERSIRSGEIRKNVQIKNGSQVVRVGDEHVFVSILEEGIEASRPFECGVKITVTRRTPFVVFVGFTNSGLYSSTKQRKNTEKPVLNSAAKFISYLKSGGIKFRNLVL